MKSYLSLIPISAKVRRQQNRMTVLCIVLAVFLVTAIFGIADMVIQKESSLLIEKHGNWHIKLENVMPGTETKLLERPDVTAVGMASVLNFDAGLPYYVNGKKAVLYGTESAYMGLFPESIAEGVFPSDNHEVLLSPNAKAAFQIKPGDRVTLRTPAGNAVFTVSGFGTDDQSYYNGQTYLVGVYMTKAAFDSLMEQNGISGLNPSCYIQFASAAKAAKARPELPVGLQIPEKSVSENLGAMGLAGQSSRETMKNLYGLAAILFVLVLLAGILMISGSMNSSIARRTQFFGMLRCIGASRAQIIRLVRLEALSWCGTAVPVGLISGTLACWGICGALRYGIGGEFSTMPMFRLSPAGLVSGALVGIVTVIFAAQAPAKRAARISPMSAVSGNAAKLSSARHSAGMNFGKIDSSLGVHHATASKKSWCLLTASFALSILLFFSFSVIMDMARLLLPSLSVTSADITMTGYGNKLIIDRDTVETVRAIPGVLSAYGSSYLGGIPATSSRAGIDHVNMVSYDSALLDYARESVVQGNLENIYGDSKKVATVFNKNNSLRPGDTVQIAGDELEVSCALSQGLFGDDLIVICSQETFDRLMGETKYGIIGIQLGPEANEETVSRIQSFENEDIIIGDRRESNRRDTATYWASRIICYGFLAIIGIITLFNILNSISMSVSARTRQYGIMRAVGMDGNQLTRMIFSESLTYAVSGLILGLGTGIPLSRYLYTELITRHFGIAWRLPVPLLCVVVLFVSACAVIAVHVPAKRLREAAITETINEL